MKIKTLVVEDGLVWAEKFRQTLNEEKFECTFVRSLQEAVDLLNFAKFDLLLLDLVLKDSFPEQTIDGIALAVSKNSLPIIVISSIEDEEIKEKAFSNGIVEFITKEKFSIDILLQAISTASIKLKASKLSLENQSDSELKLISNYLDLLEKISNK